MSSRELFGLAATMLLMTFFLAGHSHAQGLGQQATLAASPASTTGQATPGAVSTAGGMMGAPVLYPACPAADASGAMATVSLATANATANATVGSGSTGGSGTTAAGTPAVATVASMEGGTAAPTANVTAQPGAGYLGIRAEAVENCGVRVIEILLGTSAGADQLQVGDVIVAIDGQPLSGLMAGGMMGTPSTGTTAGAGATAVATTGAGGATTGNAALTEAFYRLLQNRRPDDSVTLTIQRAGQQRDVLVTLTAVPPGMVTAAPAITGTTAGTMATP